MGTYSLRSESSEISGSSFPYAEGPGFGRVLRFTIDDYGQVSVNDQMGVASGHLIRICRAARPELYQGRYAPASTFS